MSAYSYVCPIFDLNKDIVSLAFANESANCYLSSKLIPI